jgi:hypothetical protein
MEVWVGPMDSLKRPEPATAWLPSCAAAPAPVKEDGHIVPEEQPEEVARLIENFYAGVIVRPSPPQADNDCPLPFGERAG